MLFVTNYYFCVKMNGLMIEIFNLWNFVLVRLYPNNPHTSEGGVFLSSNQISIFAHGINLWHPGGGRGGPGGHWFFKPNQHLYTSNKIVSPCHWGGCEGCHTPGSVRLPKPESGRNPERCSAGGLSWSRSNRRTPSGWCSTVEYQNWISNRMYKIRAD
jgi:hypothetical protein